MVDVVYNYTQMKLVSIYIWFVDLEGPREGKGATKFIQLKGAEIVVLSPRHIILRSV